MLKNSTKKTLSVEQISKTVLQVMQADARVASVICSHLIPDILEGYALNGNQLVDNYGNKVIIRVFTEKGCDLTPSNMKGSGRKFDAEEFDRYYNVDVDTVLLVDVTKLPTIEIVEILGCEIAEMGTRAIPGSHYEKFFN